MPKKEILLTHAVPQPGSSASMRQTMTPPMRKMKGVSQVCGENASASVNAAGMEPMATANCTSL